MSVCGHGCLSFRTGSPDPEPEPEAPSNGDVTTESAEIIDAKPSKEGAEQEKQAPAEIIDADAEMKGPLSQKRDSNFFDKLKKRVPVRRPILEMLCKSVARLCSSCCCLSVHWKSSKERHHVWVGGWVGGERGDSISV